MALKDIAPFIGAIASSGALLIASLAYARQGRDSRSKQASRVITWTAAIEGNENQVAWGIHNMSDLPIYEVTIDHEIGSPQEDRHLRGVTVNGKFVIDRLDGDTGKHPRELETGRTPIVMLTTYVGAKYEHEVSTIKFTDAAGYRWQRLSSGELKELRWWKRE